MDYAIRRLTIRKRKKSNKLVFSVEKSVWHLIGLWNVNPSGDRSNSENEREKKLTPLRRLVAEFDRRGWFRCRMRAFGVDRLARSGRAFSASHRQDAWSVWPATARPVRSRFETVYWAICGMLSCSALVWPICLWRHSERCCSPNRPGQSEAARSRLWRHKLLSSLRQMDFASRTDSYLWLFGKKKKKKKICFEDLSGFQLLGVHFKRVRTSMSINWDLHNSKIKRSDSEWFD